MDRRARSSRSTNKNCRKTWNNQRSVKTELPKKERTVARTKSNAKSSKKLAFDRRSVKAVTQEEIIANEAAIYQFKTQETICARCGQPIKEIIGAIADKVSGEPVHFDCVLQHLQNTEHIHETEKIIYIGQGRFGVVQFENPHDLRRFTIKRIIEWEGRESRPAWRSTIAGLYSQVH